MKKQYKDERLARKMDFKNRLQRQYIAIVEDLDVKYILDELYQKDVLSSSDFNNILNMTNREEQARFLLDYLMQKGTVSTFEAFVDSLAKDYRWLYEKLIDNHEQIMDDSFEDSLSKGDVPRLPDHHVRRTAIESLLAEKLRQLKRHKILVLLGMSGSGKTCVALSTLRDNPELITNDFNGVVLWLNLGNCKTDDDIIAQQTKLLRKASSMYNIQRSYMNSTISMSSIGSNDNSLSNPDYTLLEMRDRLKTQFLEQTLKECLLVLDEVNDRKCLEALDIGCKILITTRDTDVVANYHPQILKIENSLKKAESLEIFASCLDESVSKLPRQAKTLHELCKGNPFHIALIGAQLAENKEKLKHDRKHWDYYVRKLEKKEFSMLFSSKPNENPMKTIEVCINALNDNILPLFKKLAILPDNVQVSTKVISKLWNREILEVKAIMKQLKDKSLIIETYDRDKRSYLYEVHDIIMDYLKTCIKKEEKHKIHDQFLTSYGYTNNNAPLEILDDGYIAFYVGYHILNTDNMNQKWNLFKKLFLDLKFLGNKVRLTGPADVILDLQKYEDKIAADDLDRSLIAHIKSYLSTHGTDLYHYQCTDIIQSILQHESQGILFTRASEVAQINCEKNELYFDFLRKHEQDCDGIKHSTIDVIEQITCISFLGNDLLVGTSDGVVKFFDIPTNKLKKELYENETSGGEPVKWIGVAYSRNPPIVAVLFSTGVIKLWYIDDIDQDIEDDVIEEEPEEIYNNNVPGTMTIKCKLSPIIRCRWTIKEDCLIAQTVDMIVLYLPSGDVVNVIDIFERNVRLLCSVPCSNDKYVAVATTGSRKGVEIVDMKTKERYISFEDPTPESESVLDMLAVPGSNRIITLKSREVTQHEFKIYPSSTKKCNTFETRIIITSSDVKDSLNFLSIAVNKTGTLLFISTDDSRVMCVDLKTNSHLFDLDNRRGNVVTMAVSEILMWDEFVPGSDVLLTGTGTIEKSAKVWYLDAPYISQSTHKNGKVRLTTKFDVSFLHSSSPSSPNSTNSTESANQTRKRHQSFANHDEVKKVLKSTLSLDRRGLKPLVLKGICNNSDVSTHPLIAVVDDKNNIQVLRGRTLLTEVVEKSDDRITTVKITPCNQHIIYGLESGNVKRYTLRTKEVITIMDLYSPVQYMSFVHSNLLMVAGKNRCIMASRLRVDGSWKTEMLQRGNTNLGSQEILNDIQGVKKKTSLSDGMSHSSSEKSLESNDRLFPNKPQTKELCKGSRLVDCFAVQNDLITVENNATIKLWDKYLMLSCVLNGRQPDVNVRCAAFKNNVLVICDGRNMMFQTFQLVKGSQTELKLMKEMQINNEITSCDLTADGNILAMGLNSGNVLIWNVKAQVQISLLRHHKSKVQSCSFSAVPSRQNRSSGQYGAPQIPGDEQPPLVLVTMAAEIVWWDISYDMRMRAGNRSGRINLNAMTPLASPHESRLELSTDDNANSSGSSTNFFFAEGLLDQHCWKAIWKSKTYKEGSKRKEILACIKLTGMNSKRLCHDEKFSCFVTVDNPGHIHIMNVIKKQCT